MTRSKDVLVKIERPVEYADGDERNIRHLRRHYAKLKYSQSSSNLKGKKQQPDDNYAFFLKFYDEASSLQHADDTDNDPQYQKFLSFLKPSKISYALDLVEGDGTSYLFTYEDENETSNRPTHIDYPNAAAQEKTGGVLDVGKGKCFKSTDKPSETLGRSVTEDKMGAENTECSPLEESLKVGSDYESLKSVASDSKKLSIDVSYQFYLSQILKLKLGENLSCHWDSKKSDIRFVASRHSKLKRKLVDVVAEDASDIYPFHAVQSSRKKPCSKNHNQSGSDLKFDRPINDTYKAFLSGLRNKEGHLYFQSEERKAVTDEMNLKGSSTDSESDSESVIITGERVNGYYRKYCSSVPRKFCLQDSELDRSRTIKDSPFKKKLMKILRKPYDQEEYELLMEKAEKRNPMEGYRDLRSGGRRGTYDLEYLGKSYLDHHKDVADAIKRCKGDRQKVLIILRGFMYWLEYIANEDQFKPWIFKECLEVQPQKSSFQKGMKCKAKAF